MRFKNTQLSCLSTALPPNGITSAEIEEHLSPLYDRLRLPKGRLELMTGIKERRYWPASVTPSQASAFAAQKALEKWNGDKRNIDLLIHSGVCRDRLEPATAAYVHGQLGLSGRTQILDVSNACLGFLNAVILAAGLIEAGQISTALVCTGEIGKPLLDKTLKLLLEAHHDRNSIKPLFANLTIGSAAVAAIVEREDTAIGTGLRVKLLNAVHETDSSHNHLCQGGNSSDGEGLEMLTDSEALLEAGLKVAERAWISFKQETGWTSETPDRVICHQVGRAHQKRLLSVLGISETKDFCTYPALGNTGSAALPFTLAEALSNGVLTNGSKVALLGIGSGLSSIMMAVEIN